MQSTDIPARFPKAFANAAGASYIRTIPATAPAATSTDAPAGYDKGFPPETFNAEAAGGIPPNGKDMNGILNAISAWAVWSQSGGMAPYSSTYATSIGGYPKGARLPSVSQQGLTWVSTTEANSTDPDGASAAGWVAEGDIGHSYGASGYYTLPGGLILNWGTAQLTNSMGYVDVTFGKAFPNQFMTAVATPASGPSNPSCWTGWGLPTKTGMRIGMSVVPSGTGGGSGVPAGAGSTSYWWALGT